MNSTLMYYTILERVLLYLSVGLKSSTYTENIYLIFYLLREAFMNLKAFLVTFCKHFLKVLVFCFSLGQQ